MPSLIIYSAQKTGFVRGFKYANPKQFDKPRLDARLAVIVGHWPMVEKAYRDVGIAIYVVTPEELKQVLENVGMDNKADKVAEVAGRIEAVASKADKVAEKLDKALTETDELLDLTDGVAKSFLTVNAKLQGILGVTTNHPPAKKEGD